MKLTNTTHLAPHFIRRMVSWCCREIDLPARSVKVATFCRRTYGTGCNGRAWYRSEILVRVGPDRGYPIQWDHRGVELVIPDQLAAIVCVTAHELQHLKNWHTPGMDAKLRADRDMEPHCVRIGKAVMLRFEEHRVELLAAWNKVPARQAADRGPRNIVAERAAKVTADLARWERKLKLARTKVAKLKQRVAYYAKRATDSRIPVTPPPPAANTY